MLSICLLATACAETPDFESLSHCAADQRSLTEEEIIRSAVAILVGHRRLLVALFALAFLNAAAGLPRLQVFAGEPQPRPVILDGRGGQPVGSIRSCRRTARFAPNSLVN